ncbi:MAG: glycosyltransferase family A protein [Candidatus Delongbacteria bacterium]
MNHTFIIPAYKESPYLEECVKSLQSQTVKSKILITTSTPSEFLNAISAKYEIPLIVNPERKGIAQDWNFSFSLAETGHVTLAHQDDVYCVDYTEKCLKKAEKHPGNLIIFTGYSELYGSEKVSNNLLLIIKRILLLPYFFTDNIDNKVIKKSLLLFGSPISCPGVMYNKKNLKNFSFDEKFTVNMDWNAWIELSRRKGSFVYESEKLFLHRIHEEAETSKAFSDRRRNDEDLVLFKKMWPDIIARLLAKLYSLSYRSK